MQTITNNLIVKLSHLRQSLLRNVRINIISVLGLSLAFSVTIFISIYVYDQLNMDRTQSNYNRIYRLERNTWASLAGGVIPWVAEHYSEVESYVRIGGTYWESMLSYDNKYHNVKDVLFADGDPFEVFDFEFVYGNPRTALKSPNSVVLTSSMARRIFADNNPVGKLIFYNRDFPLEVTAVVEDRSDLHLEFDIIVNFTQLKDIWYGGDETFMSRVNGSQNYMGYFILNTSDVNSLAEKINNRLVTLGFHDDNNPPGYLFRPFGDIYFNNSVVGEQGVYHGNRQTVIALIFVAVFILVVASINFINITSSEGISRAKEIGLKKLLGSGRLNLVFQFMLESAFLCMLAMLTAILLLFIFYHPLQSVIGILLPGLKALPVKVWVIVVLILVVTSLSGGLYPAVFLSSLRPGSLFSSDLRSGVSGVFVRRILILVQFSISIFLTIQSLAVLRQYNYLKNADLGFDTDKLIMFEIPEYLSDKTGAMRELFKKHTAIEEVTFSLQPIGNIRNTYTLNSPKNQQGIPFKVQLVDPEHFDVLGIEILSGHRFSRERESENATCWIINETGARAMGYEPPESITGLRWAAFGDTEYEIIGLVKDYHFNPLNKPIEPSFLLWREGYNMTVLRFVTDDVNSVLNHILDVWNEFEPDRPLNYSFLDETFDENYVSEKKLGILLAIFTIIAVLIGSFGVYGISAFMARQMSKNITLRKVMGGETFALVKYFSREYFLLVCFAGLIAIPSGIVYVNQWLSRFPYRVNIEYWIFVLAFILNLLVAVLTMAHHAFRTARLNPVTVLRYE